MELPEINQGGDNYLLREQEIFHGKMEYAQNAINYLQSEKQLGADLIFELREDLNNDCPYLNRLVLIGGIALVPIVDEDFEEVTKEEWQYSVHVGQHLGVDVIPDIYGNMSIMQKIFAGSYEQEHDLDTVSSSSDMYQYFFNSASITFVDDLEEGFNPYYLSEDYDHQHPLQSLRVIIQKSRELSRIFKDTGFRRMKKPSQKKIIEDFVNEISSHTSLNGLNLIIEAELAYTTKIAEKGEVTIGAINVSDSVVSGECLAVDSLEMLIMPESRIYSNSNMMVPGAGLFLVIDPDDDTRLGLGLNETQVLHLPISNQNICFEIDG